MKLLDKSAFDEYAHPGIFVKCVSRVVRGTLSLSAIRSRGDISSSSMMSETGILVVAFTMAFETGFFERYPVYRETILNI